MIISIQSQSCTWKNPVQLLNLRRSDNIVEGFGKINGRTDPCFWCRTGNVITTSTISEERCKENHLKKLKKIKNAEENTSAFCVVKRQYDKGDDKNEIQDQRSAVSPKGKN